MFLLPNRHVDTKVYYLTVLGTGFEDFPKYRDLNLFLYQNIHKRKEEVP